MKWADVKNKASSELLEDLRQSRAKLVDLRFKAHSGALKQVRQIRVIRKDIAMILTKLHQMKHNNMSKNNK